MCQYCIVPIQRDHPQKQWIWVIYDVICEQQINSQKEAYRILLWMCTDTSYSACCVTLLYLSDHLYTMSISEPSIRDNISLGHPPPPPPISPKQCRLENDFDVSHRAFTTCIERLPNKSYKPTQHSTYCIWGAGGY